MNANIWNVSKDNVEKCNLCQYRYVCNDMSELIKTNHTYERVSDCEYDIENNVWN